MARRRTHSNPPPPPNAENYVLVKTREGNYWRRKRGTVKEATLNEGYAAQSKRVAYIAPVAARIKKKLNRYLTDLQTGRMVARLTAKLTKTFNQSEKVDYSLLQRMEMQPDHHLDSLLRAHYFVVVEKGEVQVKIRIYPGAVKKLNQDASDYFFELILLYGDPMQEYGLRTESVESKVYQLTKEPTEDCILSLVLPETKFPWMALLKLSTMEGSEMAVAGRHYGLRVIAVG